MIRYNEQMKEIEIITLYWTFKNFLKIKKKIELLKEQLIKILIKSCKLMYELNIILKSKKYIM